MQLFSPAATLATLCSPSLSLSLSLSLCITGVTERVCVCVCVCVCSACSNVVGRKQLTNLTSPTGQSAVRTHTQTHRQTDRQTEKLTSDRHQFTDTVKLSPKNAE